MSATERVMMTTSQNKPSMTRVRTLAILALTLLCASTPQAQQGTVMPVPKQQFFDNNGDPLADGLLYTYAAGTSTPLATCTTVDNPCVVPNANPVELDSAGRATVYLSAASYKFILADADNVTIWTQDFVSSVAPYNVYLDIAGTAGENLAAGDTACLSDGTGARTQGRWYKCDADFTYASSEAPFVGMAPSAITSAASGSIRLQGLVTVTGPLGIGTTYYASATAGALTATVPTNARVIGVAHTATSVLVAPLESKLPNLSSAAILNAIQLSALVPGRCSLTTGLAVTTADVTAATTLYYALSPKRGTQIGLYTGSVWVVSTIAQLSIAVPATTNQMYDVWVDYNDGTPALAVTAWTSDTARATALTTQDGIYVKTGDTQQRYVCSFRTTAVSGQTEDSFAKRFVWNYYNQATRRMRVLEGTNTWSYNTATWRQANASTANQLAFVIGVADVELNADLRVVSTASAAVAISTAIGLDSTTAPTTPGNYGMGAYTTSALNLESAVALQVYPAVGYHFAAWLEIGDGSGNTVTWIGDNGGTTIQSGLSGVILG